MADSSDGRADYCRSSSNPITVRIFSIIEKMRLELNLKTLYDRNLPLKCCNWLGICLEYDSRYSNYFRRVFITLITVLPTQVSTCTTRLVLSSWTASTTFATWATVIRTSSKQDKTKWPSWTLTAGQINCWVIWCSTSCLNLRKWIK